MVLLWVSGLSSLLPTGKLPLLCVMKNPWGHKEWRGPWSDGDTRNWTRENKKLLGYSPQENDGEFVIAYDDAIRVFDMAEMSLLFPQSE